MRGDTHPARDDRTAVVERLVDRLPDRVARALRGDREALIGLLMIAADVAWQSRSEVLGSVEEVAARAHEFADEVADCYADDRPPSDRMCDAGFVLADRVDALAIELRLRRREVSPDAGAEDSSTLPEATRPTARETRHLAHAHVAALRAAAQAHHLVTAPDVEAAEELYRAVVALGRQQMLLALSAALRSPPVP